MDCTPSGLTEGAKEVKIRELNETLCDIAREGDLDALYEALKRDPKVLDKIDKIPFVQTPLHEAVSHSPLDEDKRTEFALELLNLKPSFGRKLNPDGESPLHLAVRKGSSNLAKQLIKYDSELIRVKGRGGKTPLHLVAETGDSKTETNLLAEFLCACPESIKDLTIRDETAFHLAVKQRQFEAFKLIFEWMWRSYNGDLLIWKDHHGNTVLHIAASTNQLKIVRYLVRRAPIINIERNSIGQIAFDIAQDEGIKKILRERKKVPIPESVVQRPPKNTTTDLDKLLLSPEPYFETFLRFILYCRRELSLDMRSMVLVVAVLIATATYQDLGNLRDTDTHCSSCQNSINYSSDNPTPSSHNNMRHYSDMTFYFLNTISFTASVAVMISILSFRPVTSFLHLSLVFLAITYGYKMVLISRMWSAAPFLVIILLVYAFKIIFFMSMEKDIKMIMPSIWISPHSKWRRLLPVSIAPERLRLVYQLIFFDRQKRLY